MEYVGDFRGGEVLRVPGLKGYTIASSHVQGDHRIEEEVSEYEDGNDLPWVAIKLSDMVEPGAYCLRLSFAPMSTKADDPQGFAKGPAVFSYSFSIGRQVRPEEVPGPDDVVDANLVLVAGKEAPLSEAGYLGVDVRSAEGTRWEEGAVSRNAIANGAINAQKLAPNAISPKSLSAACLDAFAEAMGGRIATNDQGHVRVAAGTDPGEIDLENGAIGAVRSPVEIQARFPGLDEIASAVAVVLQDLLVPIAKVEQIENLEIPKASDIVVGGPIDTDGGAVGHVVTVGAVDKVRVVTEAVAKVTGDVEGQVIGSVGAVAGALGGEVGGLGEEARAALREELINVLCEMETEEFGYGEPSSNASIAAKLGFLYKVERTRKVEVMGKNGRRTIQYMNEDGATVDHVVEVSKQGEKTITDAYGRGPVEG